MNLNNFLTPTRYKKMYNNLLGELIIFERTNHFNKFQYPQKMEMSIKRRN